MKRHATVAFLVVIAATVATAWAQDTLTLEDAIGMALEKNHDIQIARNNVQMGRNAVNVGNAGLMPSIDLTSAVNYHDQNPAHTPDMTFSQSTARVSASYTLFNGLENVYKFRSLKKGSMLEELQARSSIELTVLQVSRAYYDLANAQEQFLIAEEALSISNVRYQRAVKQSEYGQVNTVDVLSALVDLNTDSTSYLNAALLVDQTQRNLNKLLNTDFSTRFSVETEVSYAELPDLEAVEELAFQSNADYLIASTSLEQAELDLKMARAQYLPRLGLQTSYGYNQTSPGFAIDYGNPDREFTAMLSLSFNLFNGFRDKIRSDNAKIVVNNLELNQSKTQLELKRRVADAYDVYENSLTILELQGRNLESAELNFRRTQELYNLGQVTTTTFREAQLNLIRSRNNISSAKFNAKVAELEILRLTGQLVGEGRSG